MRERLRQFREATLLPGPEEYALARDYLEGELLRLFEAQHPRDIRHAAGTARWLLMRGHADAELVQAALLHDIAKGPQRRRDRVAWVLLCHAKLGDAAACGDSRLEVRRALARTRDHASVGAEWLRAAGASARVAELTARHHGSAAGDPVLALLQQADAAS